MIIGFLHFFQAQPDDLSCPIDHNLGLLGNLIDLRDEPLDLLQLDLLLLQDSAPDGVFILVEKFPLKRFLMVDIVDFVEVGISDVLVPLGSHVVQLFLELLGLISLNELFVHLDYFIVKLGVFIYLA